MSTPRVIGSPVVGIASKPPPAHRNPWVVWGLTLATFGIFGAVNHFRVTEELRAFTSSTLPTHRIRTPGSLALVLLLLLGPIELISMASRIRHAGSLAGIDSRCGGFVSVLAALIGAPFAYQQHHCNRIWERVEAVRAERELEASRVTEYERPSTSQASTSQASVSA